VSLEVGRIAILGNGVVGRRVTKHVASTLGRPSVDIDTRRVDLTSSPFLDEVTVAVLAHPGPHHPDSMALLDRGISVISVGDRVEDVAAMIGEADRAARVGASIVVGAGMSPGLVGLIARHLTAQLATADELHVAIHGTAGPACARQHHRSLAGHATAFDDGAFVTFRAGSGRELAWFPEPVGAYDCYRAAVPAPVVLHRTFPDVERISARMSANRRDRVTSRLPMLTPPHGEGGVGAVRVEVRGSDETGARVTLIAGIAEMVGTATAATVVAYLDALLNGVLPVGLVLPGDENVDTTALLHTIERSGVRLQEFTGVPVA
jgi:hypothetical protein